MAIKLSKAGYGKVDDILCAGLDTVLGIVEYERFTAEYEEAFIELNKESN